MPAFFVFSLPLLSFYLHPCASCLVLRREPSCSPSSLSSPLCPIRCRVNFLPLLDIARASSPSSFFVPCSVHACSATTPTPYFFPNFFVAPLFWTLCPAYFFVSPVCSCARHADDARVAKQHEEECAARRPVFISIRGIFWRLMCARRACSLSEPPLTKIYSTTQNKRFR